jgi:outer membrane receptor protein involved in Fe transport
LSGSVFAQRSEEGSTSYETVVRASARLPESPVSASEFPASVQVMTREEISQSGATTLQEALQGLAGGSLNDEQGNSLQPDVTIRGFTGSPVTGLSQGISVFVDGVRVNEPDVEEINFDLIPLDEVDRIELIRGPSAQFGRNSLAGSLNIITRRGRGPLSVTAEVSAGSFGRERYRIHASGSEGRVDYLFAVTESSERGFRTQSSSRTSQLLGKLGYDTESSTVAVSYQYQSDRIHQAGSLPLSLLLQDRNANFTPGDFFSPHLHLGTINASHRTGRGFTVTANAFVRILDVEQFNAGLLAPNTRLFNNTRSFGGILQVSHRQSLSRLRNHVILGAEYSHHEVRIRVYEEQNERSLAACQDQPDADCPLSRFIADLSDGQDPFGFYVFDTLRLGPGLFARSDVVTISAGLRFDRLNNDIVDNSPIQPGRATGTALFHKWISTLGINYSISDQFGLYVAYKEGFRAPAFLEITCADPQAPCVGLQAGVAPDATISPLRPVRAKSYEAGLRAQLGAALNASAALFRTDLQDDIYSVSPTPAAVYFQNVGATRRQGLELAISVSVREWLRAQANYTFTRATFESAFSIASPRTPDADQEVTPGDQLPLVPRHRFNAGVHYSPRPWLTLSLDGTYVGDQYFRGDEANTQPKLSDYFVLGAGARAQWKGFTAAVHVNNVLNTKYETFGTFANTGTSIEPFLTPGPPTRLDVTLSYRF